MPLTGKKKAEFLARMAKGRAAAKRKKKPNPPPKHESFRKAKKRAKKQSAYVLTRTSRPFLKESKREFGRKQRWHKTKGMTFHSKTRRNANPPPGKAIQLQSGQITSRGTDVSIGGVRVASLDSVAQAERYKAALIAARRLAYLRTKKNPARRRNEEGDMSAAEQLYEDFHGRPHNRIVEHADEHEYRSELAELGKLLVLHTDLGDGRLAKTKGFGDCQVACTPDGSTIYFLGGSQAIDLADFGGIETDKDYIELGECTYIEYFTKKGFHNFDPIRYQHDFGEEDSIRPVLAYDRINEKLFLLGGNYTVRPEGIVN